MSLETFNILVQAAAEGDGGAVLALEDYGYEHEEFKDTPRLARVPNVEIFKAGHYRGKDYTIPELAKMVENFYDLKDKEELRPTVCVGHNEDQSFLEDSGYPSAGVPENIRLKGDILLADFEKVPLEVAKLINGRAYNSVSAEIYDNFEDSEGNEYGKTLRRVALLGAELPQVKTLKELPLAEYCEKFSEMADRHPGEWESELTPEHGCWGDQKSHIYQCFMEVRPVSKKWKKSSSPTKALRDQRRVQKLSETKDVAGETAKPMVPPSSGKPQVTPTIGISEPASTGSSSAPSPIDKFGDYKQMGKPVLYNDHDIYGVDNKFVAVCKKSGSSYGKFPSVKKAQEYIDKLKSAQGSATVSLENHSEDLPINRFDDKNKEEEEGQEIDVDAVEEETEVSRDDLLELLQDYGVDVSKLDGASDDGLVDVIRVMSMLEDQAEIADKETEEAEKDVASKEDLEQTQGGMPPMPPMEGDMPPGAEGGPDVMAPGGPDAGGPEGDLPPVEGETPPAEEEEQQSEKPYRKHNEEVGGKDTYWKSQREQDEDSIGVDKQGWFYKDEDGQEHGPYKNEAIMKHDLQTRKFSEGKQVRIKHPAPGYNGRVGKVLGNNGLVAVQYGRDLIQYFEPANLELVAAPTKESFSERTQPMPAATKTKPDKKSAFREWMAKRKQQRTDMAEKKTPEKKDENVATIRVFSENGAWFVEIPGLPAAGPFRSEEAAKKSADNSVVGLQKFAEWDRVEVQMEKLKGKPNKMAEKKPKLYPFSGKKMADKDDDMKDDDKDSKDKKKDDKDKKCCPASCDCDCHEKKKKDDKKDSKEDIEFDLDDLGEMDYGEKIMAYAEKKGDKTLKLVSKVLAKAQEALTESKKERVDAFCERMLGNGHILPSDLALGLKNRLLNADDKKLQKFGELAQEMTSYQQMCWEIESGPVKRKVGEAIRQSIPGLLKMSEGKDQDLLEVERYAEVNEADLQKLSGPKAKEEFIETFKETRKRQPGVTAALFCQGETL